MKKINTLVLILLLLQLPVVAVKFYLYGIAEMTMGAYSKSGGVTTMLPIVVIFYLAAYYLLYRPKGRYILIGIGFVLFSIVGKKRAVAFLYPLQFLTIYYYIYLKGKGANLPRKVNALILSFALILLVSGSIFYLNETLNPERKVGGGVDVKYAFNYAIDYNTAERGEEGYTTGWVSTTIRVYEKLWKSGFTRFVFGYGPGSMTASIFDSRRSRMRVERLLNEVNIRYGITSITRIALEYGVLGTVPYSLMIFLLARMCYRYHKCETDPYWKAFAAGSVGFSFSMLFFYCVYTYGAFWGDTMPPLYFYAMAVVYTRLQRVRNNLNTSAAVRI